MGLWLKQSTAITVKIGPFIDDTDGKTAETGLTLTQADIRLSKNGANIAQKNEANAATTDELGYYDCPLDATDTGTLGILQLFVHESGALPVFHEYMVVPANVWDSFFGADKLDVNTAELANIDFGATMKASINAEVDTALNTAIPALPTANSINERIATLDDDWNNGGRLDLLIDSIIIAANVAAAYSIVNSGISFRGIVTNIPGANQFKIGTLAGIGAGTFNDTVSPWYAYVFRDNGGAGAAPQGEYKKITAYVTADGTFTTEAFTAPGVEVGDDVIITSNVLSNVIMIKAKTDNLPANTATELATIGGYVDTEIGAIKAVTDTLSLAAIAGAVHDEAVEGAYTLREAMRIVLAALGGKLSGAGTGTLTFRDANDTADRIVATVDASNNRTGVALTP